jgi:hypothetical protein
MNKTTGINQLFEWIKTTELFQKPVKLLPGKWNLYEYYIEPDKELLHYSEQQIIEGKHLWTIDLSADGSFRFISNLKIPFIVVWKSGIWKKSGNYLSFMSSEKHAEKLDFQFSVEKRHLKLLKKDAFGKIEIFGFFRKAE